MSTCAPLIHRMQNQAYTKSITQTKEHQESSVTKGSQSATCGESQRGRTFLLLGSLHPHCPGCPRRRGYCPQASVHLAYTQWGARSLHRDQRMLSAHLLK